MNMQLSKLEFLKLRNYIESTCGIQVPEDKEYLIQNRFLEVMKSQGLDSFEELCEKVIDKCDLVLSEKVIDAITTNETYWFRDSGTWNGLKVFLLPYFIEKLRKNHTERIRIWSCGCSTGQEPYTIAMVIDSFLNEQGVLREFRNNFEIVASDISERALQKARRGVYDYLSMARGMPEEFKDRYFVKSITDQSWSIKDEVKQYVKFEKINLKNMHYINYSDLSLVFIRNVLIYFDEDLKNKILDKISTMVKPDGVIFLGASELLTNKNFKRRENNESIYYILENSNV